MGPTVGMPEGMSGLPHPLDAPQAYLAPVMGTPAGGGIGLAFAGSPASMLMAKTAISPKFTGMQKDWVNFHRDWEHYVQLLEGRKEISNSIVLCTLGETLDEDNQLSWQ